MTDKTYRYAFGDDDASDHYAFTVSEGADTTRWAWRLERCPDHGVIETPRASVEEPRSIYWFSQGAVIAGHEEVRIPSRDVPVSVEGALPFFSPSPVWAKPGPVTLAMNFTTCVLERADEARTVEVELDGQRAELTARPWRSRGNSWEVAEVLVSEDPRFAGLLGVSLDGGSIACHLVSVR